MKLEEIMQDVTPPEMWEIEESTWWSENQLEFALRAAKNFAPLVKALEYALNNGHWWEDEARKVLAEALRKET